MEHHGKPVVPTPHVLGGTEDRLPGAVARWGWCRTCRTLNFDDPKQWVGVCGNAHVLDQREVRWHPYEKRTRYGTAKGLAPVCQEGDCFEYDQMWLIVSDRIHRLTYDEFDAFVVKLAESCAAIKYQSPKTTWAQRLKCDLLAVAPVLQAAFAEQRAEEDLAAAAATDLEPGDPYALAEAVALYELLDVPL